MSTAAPQFPAHHRQPPVRRWAPLDGPDPCKPVKLAVAADLAKDQPLDTTCPRCHRPLTPQPHAWRVLRSGAHAVCCGLLLILAAVIRLVRFVVAAAFYFVGSIGALLRAVGDRLAHPADRQRLRRWSITRRRD